MFQSLDNLLFSQQLILFSSPKSLAFPSSIKLVIYFQASVFCAHLLLRLLFQLYEDGELQK